VGVRGVRRLYRERPDRGPGVYLSRTGITRNTRNARRASDARVGPVSVWLRRPVIGAKPSAQVKDHPDRHPPRHAHQPQHLVRLAHDGVIQELNNDDRREDQQRNPYRQPNPASHRLSLRRSRASSTAVLSLGRRGAPAGFRRAALADRAPRRRQAQRRRRDIRPEARP
jgi:hypothetical protein